MAYYFTLFICVFAICIGLFNARPNYQHRPLVQHDPIYPSGRSNHSGMATYYDPSMGACGYLSEADELVVAIPDALYETRTVNGNPNNNDFCGKKILVKGPIGSVQVSIVDRCGSCRGGDLDLSRPAFNAIGDPIHGRVAVSWRFV